MLVVFEVFKVLRENCGAVKLKVFFYCGEQAACCAYNDDGIEEL